MELAMRSSYFLPLCFLPLPLHGSIVSHLLLSTSVSLVARVCIAVIWCPHKTGKGCTNCYLCCLALTIPVLFRPYLRGLRGARDAWHCAPLIIRFTPIAVIAAVLAIIFVFELLESLLPVSSGRDLCVWG